MTPNIDALRGELDAAGPTPLYLQIAEALRYRISRGALPPGTRLPALRSAARAWRVNLHTVRRAYHDLVRSRLVEVRRPGGAFVAPDAGAAARDAAAGFAREVLEEGRRRFGLDARGLIELVEQVAAPPPVVTVVECSRTLAQSLSRQISRRYGVDARAVLIEELGPDARAPVIATYFHFNDVRIRLAERLEAVQFVAIEPFLTRAAALARRARAAGAPITLCERDPLLAPAIAADLRRLVGRGSEVVVETRGQPSTIFRRRVGPVVFSPQSWERLTDAERREPDAVLLDYRIAPDGLAALDALLGSAPVSSPGALTRTP